jgi:hypothetical protein
VNEINAAGGELFDGLKSGDIVTIQGGSFSDYDASSTLAYRAMNWYGFY